MLEFYWIECRLRFRALDFMSASCDTTQKDQNGLADRRFEPFPCSALESSIVERFNTIARRFPDRLAVSDCARRLTYADLATVVDRIAAAVISAVGDRPGPVAILLDRHVFFPAAMLGVLAAGRGYVPLDAGDPIERIIQIASQSGAVGVISTGDLADRVRSLFSDELPILEIERLGDVAGGHLITGPSSDDLAFIVYTSGSTGRPKGAYHSHRNLLHDVMQQTNTLHLNEEDRVALFYSPAVIAAIREIMMTLLNGASLHILPPQQLQPAGLVREIKARGITICRTVSVLLRRIAEALGPNERLNSVRVVGLGSQRVDWSDYDVFRRHFPADAFLIVGIGSTECGGNYCHWFVDDRLRIGGGRLPIGRILPDAKVTIVGDDDLPVAAGEIGEFVVASRYLALGYWRDPDLTANAFTIDPADPKTRIFKTGDMGRMRSDGLLEYACRSDQQIKLRGHRVELGEIELVLAECPGVGDAAVVVRNDEKGVAQSLAAYVEPRHGLAELQPNDLLSTLAQRLPSYMIPATLSVVVGLPRLPNLKIDRVLLQKLDATDRPAGRVHSGGAMVDMPLQINGSSNEGLLHHQILQIWQRLTKRNDIELDDDFFEIGGDSLLAAQMICEVEALTRQTIPQSELKTVFTVRGLAATLMRQIATAQELITFAKQSRGTPFFFCHGDYTARGIYALKLAEMLTYDQPIYLVHPSNPHLPMEEMARCYLPQILAAHPAGSFRFGGYCSGGLLAWEIARQLERLDRKVEFVVLIDGPSLNARPVFRALVQLNKLVAAAAPNQIGRKFAKSGMRAIWVRAKFSNGGPYAPVVSNYLPQRIASPIICLVSQESSSRMEYSWIPWTKLAEQVSWHKVPGTHYSCVTDHLGEIALLLDRYLQSRADEHMRAKHPANEVANTGSDPSFE
jgi:amino acid adenylation domain-containing protein